MSDGITIKVDDTEVQNLLKGMHARMQNPAPVYRAIGKLIRESIRTNFRDGGRPYKWKPSKRAEGQRGQTLRDTNRLYNSFTIAADNHQAEVGTNVEYAAVHNFGLMRTVRQSVREHTRRITQAFGKPLAEPKEISVRAFSRQLLMRLAAREFMLVQDEDWLDIKETITAFVIRAKA